MATTLQVSIPANPRVAGWRADTPGAATRVHLNNAGAALVPRPVSAAIAEHLGREAALGGYEAADAARDAIEAVYASVGRLIGAPAGTIALSQSATTAYAAALAAFDFRAGDSIVTTRADYASNQIMYLSLARRLGVDIIRADDLAEGGVDPESVRAIVARRRPVLVAVSWIPTNSG
ncbi:MAG: aminotransferase class V-fold PLP-dependent enzyme, partial [Gemmatimonadota bacterium]